MKAMNVAAGYLSARRTGAPIFMHLSPTTSCNLRCSYCYQWETGRTMSWDTFCSSLENARNLGVRVVAFTGGEPLLWPHLSQAIALCSSLGIGTQVTTNGYLLDRSWVTALGQAGLDMLSVSLDGAGELASSPKTIAANPGVLDLLCEMRDVFGSFVSSNFVLHQGNRDQLAPVIQTLGQRGIAASIGLYVPPPTTTGRRCDGDWGDFSEEIQWILAAKHSGVPILDPEAYFSSYADFVDGKYLWDCGEAKRGTVMVDPDGMVYWCSKLKASSRYRMSNMSLDEFRQYREEFDKLSGKCETACYSNCAFDSYHYNSHPFTFASRVLLGAVARRLRRVPLARSIA